MFNTSVKLITTLLCILQKYYYLKLLKTMSFINTDEVVEMLLFSIEVFETRRTF